MSGSIQDYRGTINYYPPELVKKFSVSKKQDIWAFGATLYELIKGEKLFKGKSKLDIVE